MALFSSSKNVTEVTNENEFNQATAGADGFAVGAGSNVDIEQVSDDIAEAAFDSQSQITRDAFDANRDVSNRAFNLADDTLTRLADFGEDALYTVADTTSRQTSDFLSFADRYTQRESDRVEDQLELNNKLAMHTSELIAAQAGVVAPADNKRNSMLAFGALALVALVVVGPQLLEVGKKSK